MASRARPDEPERLVSRWRQEEGVVSPGLPCAEALSLRDRGTFEAFLVTYD